MEFREDVRLGMKKPLSIPLMNGGGCCKTVKDVRELSDSLAGVIVVGSFTFEERSGNEGNIFWVSDELTIDFFSMPIGSAALNSLGMPNGGRKYLCENLDLMVSIAHDAREKKALVVNVAGFTPEEYADLAETCFEHGADAVELNLGCPNVVRDDGSRKPIPSFNLDLMDEILLAVEIRVGSNVPVWIKVSPYSDPGLLKGASAVVLRHPVVKAVSAINTFANAYGLKDNGKSVIDVGLAGLSGPPLKHIGLGQIKQWNDALQGEVPLIAVGGICTGRDIKDYGIVGAQAFQMTTELLKHNKLDARPFEKVITEFVGIVD